MLKIILITLLTSVQAFAGLTLTMGGDINFNKNLMRPDSIGFNSSKGKIPWNAYTANLAPMLDGDINFGNVETVVSDRLDIAPNAKTYVFETHPAAIQQLINVGFNLMNLANNHAYDYGHVGIEETIRNTQAMHEQNPQVHFVGVGKKQDLLKPYVFTKNGYTIAIASLSILDSEFKATDTTPGLLHIRDQAQFREVVRNMKMTAAHYKILSIHNGTESQVTLDSGQKAYYEYAIKNGDVDLIIGHHPHSVRPIEKIGDKYIFYSLGNYMMLGSANITGLAGGLDFGLFSKLHLVENEAGRLIPEAIEMTLLTNTHAAVKPLAKDIASNRLVAFQKLSVQELGTDALPFRINSLGQGIFCLPNLKLDSSMKACQN
ncbi:MAG: CapA family protein [Bdellovibrio sp.]|nr:CapA family protein [Bdellovibrio sp.]